MKYGIENRLQLVTEEQFKRLKKLGFDWYWALESIRPTVALALKWIRDEKEIKNSVTFFDVVSPTYMGRYQVPQVTDVGERRLKPRTSYDAASSSDYESAESALLDELLAILENK
ncbi:MAG: hypothetical protein FWC34_09165 [Bacteroidetes bacterium]|nr:hypothetical protein [Bacteroidota bacterium]